MADIINHPAHYTGITVEIECIDIARHLNFQLGNAFKYVWRAGKKGGRDKELEDYKKALWYLEDAIKNGQDGLSRCDTIPFALAEIVTRRDETVRAQILLNIACNRVVAAAADLRDLVKGIEKARS